MPRVHGHDRRLDPARPARGDERGRGTPEDAGATRAALSGDPQALAIHVINSGQGDCAIVQCPNGQNIMVDCGSSSWGSTDRDAVVARVDELLGEDGAVDVLVLTHPDRDHYNLIDDVLEGHEVRRLVHSAELGEYDQDDVDDWLEAHGPEAERHEPSVSAPGTGVSRAVFERESGWQHRGRRRGERKLLFRSAPLRQLSFSLPFDYVVRVIHFDSELRYQFVVFFSGADPDALPVDPTVVAEELTAQRPQHKDNFALKFRGQPKLEKTLTVVPIPGAIPVASEKYVWSSGSGIWRLEITDSRLDVHFDALGYSDIRESMPALSEIVARVATPLSRAPSLVNERSKRVAVVLKGAATGTTYGSQETITNHFLNPAYTNPDTRDLHVRINRSANWDIGHGSPVAVNRIEFAQIVLPKGLSWSFDANVVPDELDGFLSEESMTKFFHKGAEWIAERMEAVEVVGGADE